MVAKAHAWSLKRSREKENFERAIQRFQTSMIFSCSVPKLHIYLSNSDFAKSKKVSKPKGTIFRDKRFFQATIGKPEETTMNLHTAHTKEERKTN